MNNSRSVLSVSQLTQQIKNLLEGHFPAVTVSGEISNFIHHRSGHMYFTLKDAQAECRAVMFAGANQGLRFNPANGMQVILSGRLSVYEQRGQYQIIVSRLEPAGLGTLFLAFEALKQKLAAEGLFAAARKKPLPFAPQRIGIITSGSGAAIRDIVQVLQRRAPQVQLILRPTQVQGESAAGDIVAALEEFGAYRQVEVVILGRGGGSLEDLWPFNEERVARALAACPVPTISAVGHETDYTIADMVADLRAPTPSAAAELVTPSRAELLDFLSRQNRLMVRAVEHRLQNGWQALDNLLQRYAFRQPLALVQQRGEQLDARWQSLVRTFGHQVQIARADLVGLDHKLQALDPRRVLQRGYALATRLSDQRIITAPGDLQPDEAFELQVARGSLRARKTGES